MTSASFVRKCNGSRFIMGRWHVHLTTTQTVFGLTWIVLTTMRVNQCNAFLRPTSKVCRSKTCGRDLLWLAALFTSNNHRGTARVFFLRCARSRVCYLSNRLNAVAEQIVAREPRERVSQDHLLIQGRRYRA